KLLRPSSQIGRLKEMVTILNEGAAREKTRMAPLFHDLAERVNRRGLVFIISDFFDDVPDLLGGLRHLRHKKHDVVIWHVMDAAEMEFPFQEPTLFRGLEQFPELLTDPRSLRRGYLDQVTRFITELRQGCREQNIDYVHMRTDTSLGVALSNYLAHRLGK